MDINIRYTYDNQHNIAYLLNRLGKLRYFEPIVNYFRNSRRYWILGQSWKDHSVGQISNTNSATAARNSYGGNWLSVYSAEQSTQGIEVGYNNLNEVRSWNARRVTSLRFLTLIGPYKRAERGRVSLFGYHLTFQEFTQGVKAFVIYLLSLTYVVSPSLYVLAK